MSDHYRKKPVVIRAWQFGASMAVPEWLRLRFAVLDLVYHPETDVTAPAITIPTLEGEMLAFHGDWIIEGVKGELYPCKDDIFQATYEKVEE